MTEKSHGASGSGHAQDLPGTDERERKALADARVPKAFGQAFMDVFHAPGDPEVQFPIGEASRVNEARMVRSRFFFDHLNLYPFRCLFP